MIYNCPSCDANFEKGSNFCENCGYNLSEFFIEDPVCPKCKMKYPTNTKYCQKDGCKLVSPTDLVPRCSICKQEYSEYVKFCPKDGGKVGVLLNNRNQTSQQKQIAQQTQIHRVKPVMFARPFSFEGRIRRTEYAISIFILPLIYFMLMIALTSGSRHSSSKELLGVFITISFIPVLWFLFAQTTKRCHDIGNSGWYQLIPYYTIWLLFADSEKGKNQYGDNPKGIN